MQRFFPDFESIERFTLSLGCFAEKLQCPHCAKNDQLVSHGVIYRQRSMMERAPVGKRVFCSNRYQRTGCGRTTQLYVATVIPAMQYAAAQVFVFLSALLMHASVDSAYQAATGRSDARQGWRWLNKLNAQLTAFRSFLHARLAPPTPDFNTRCRRLRLLLPTLQPLLAQLPTNPCAHYQLQCQQALF